MSFFKKTVAVIASPITFPIAKATEIASGAYQRETNKSKRIIARRQEILAKNLDPELLKEMQQSRSALLSRWGITDDKKEIARVKNGLATEAAVYAIASTSPLIGLLVSGSAPTYWVAAVTVTPLFLFIASTKIWRRDCITMGHLVTYKAWWRGGER